ncbi:MAG: hypothetical protein KME42_06525 [Tildeniella nuda ZEHNDER 1965/U140]|jgi:hypothetical protein|nr:hypothetical protein [Tildeniella nuda ZEHNDER 1965/U140]
MPNVRVIDQQCDVIHEQSIAIVKQCDAPQQQCDALQKDVKKAQKQCDKQQKQDGTMQPNAWLNHAIVLGLSDSAIVWQCDRPFTSHCFLPSMFELFDGSITFASYL